MLSSSPLIIAHRGGLEHAPENSLPAFETAWHYGADGIEGDFHQTRDGHFVCIHDGTTKRTCDKNLLVKHSTLEQLRALDNGAGQIPTLEEFVAAIPTGRYGFVELKFTADVVPNFAATLKKIPHHDRVHILTFHSDTVIALKKYLPSTPVYLAHYQAAETTLLEAKRTGADGIDINGYHPNLTALFLQKARDMNLSVHTFTVNETKRADYLKQIGVASITTDYPSLIRTH